MGLDSWAWAWIELRDKLGPIIIRVKMAPSPAELGLRYEPAWLAIHILQAELDSWVRVEPQQAKPDLS